MVSSEGEGEGERRGGGFKVGGGGGRNKEQPASERNGHGENERHASLFLFYSLFPLLAILPDAKISAVVFGSRMRMMTAAKRCFGSRGEEEERGKERGK